MWEFPKKGAWGAYFAEKPVGMCYKVGCEVEASSPGATRCDTHRVGGGRPRPECIMEHCHRQARPGGQVCTGHGIDHPELGGNLCTVCGKKAWQNSAEKCCVTCGLDLGLLMREVGGRYVAPYVAPEDDMRAAPQDMRKRAAEHTSWRVAQHASWHKRKRSKAEAEKMDIDSDSDADLAGLQRVAFGLRPLARPAWIGPESMDTAGPAGKSEKAAEKSEMDDIARILLQIRRGV